MISYYGIQSKIVCTNGTYDVLILLETGVNVLPNIKSAKKRVLITERKSLQNQMFKSALKTTIKKYDAAIAAGDKAAAGEAYKAAVKKIDQAAAKGLLHPNKAARKKSQFTRKLSEMA